MALVLARRGHDPAGFGRFLSPSIDDLSDWDSIPGMRDAAAILAEAASRGSRVLIWGDFDADGLTASAVMNGALEAAGAVPSIHIPDRMEDGYGLGGRAVEIASETGAGTLVTVDCGINACAEVAALESAGIRTVVTDHHEPGPELPKASAIVDPRMSRTGDPCPWASLSGSGTAFLLGRALSEMTGTPGMPGRSIALACIGTICDIVPLSGDNRIIARLGLEMLRNGAVPGISALAAGAGFDLEGTTGTDVSFRIGPRLNSCGRIASAAPVLELLLADSFDEAVEAADEMERTNDARRILDRKVTEEAARLSAGFEGDPALFLASPDWHKGVIGIAASRLASEEGRPVVLCAVDRDGGARGSARGVPGINLFEILSSMSGMIENFGGHAGAAGLEFRASDLEELRARFNAEVGARLPVGPDAGAVLLDGRLSEDDLTMDLARELSRMEPFGEGNEEPVWITGDARPVEWSRVGGGRHLSCSFSIGGRKLRAIGFGMGGLERPVQGSLDLAYCLRIDEFRGRRELRLHLQDVRPSRRSDGRS